MSKNSNSQDKGGALKKVESATIPFVGLHAHSTFS